MFLRDDFVEHFSKIINFYQVTLAREKDFGLPLIYSVVILGTFFFSSL